jgi:hypothetical protein
MADSNAPMTAATDMLGIVFRNMQAVTAAQQQVLEGFGQLARQQTQMAQALLRSAMPGTMKVPDPAAGIDWLKSELETGQATMNEMSQLMLTISGNAAATLQARGYAALDELKAVVVALGPAVKVPPAAAAPPAALAKLAAPAARAAAPVAA